MVEEPEKPVFTEAVRTFWGKRTAQRQEQIERGVSDQGNRSEATGGGHMNGFVETLVRLIKENGAADECIFTNKTLAVLPGFYRPTKVWDLLVVCDERLYIAIELKSLVGPSFGNNANNRAEEAIGSAADLWTAFREGILGDNPAPFVGYLFLLEDTDSSRCQVRIEEPHFNASPEFREEGKLIEPKSSRSPVRKAVFGASYAKRIEIMCRKLVRERQYTAACFLTASRDAAELVPNYTEPAPDLSTSVFLDGLMRHIP